MTFLPCKEIFDDCSKMVAGGGLVLSLLMVMLIPLMNTPALGNAAERVPVSVSVVPTYIVGEVGLGTGTNLGVFEITVHHSDGLTTTLDVRIDHSTSSDLYYITGPTFVGQITSTTGKFTELKSEPGVLIGDSIREPISDVGYSPSTACAPDGSYGCLTVALKDEPQTGVQVVQMPTTGAPTGLTTVGATALGLCLLGTSVLARRRD